MNKSLSERPDEKKKVRLTENLALKALAVVLFLAISVTAVLSAVGIIFLAGDDTFRPDASFYDSALCRNIAHNKMWGNMYPYDLQYKNFLTDLREDINDTRWPLHPDNTNLLFVVSRRDAETGETEVLTQNCDGETVGAHYETGYYYGNENEEIQIDLYVRLPLTANDEFVSAKELFDIIHANRYALIWTLSVSLALSISLFVFLMKAAGHRKGREGIFPNLLDRIPLDLLLAAIVIAIIAVSAAFGHLESGVYYWRAFDIVPLAVWALAVTGLTLTLFLSIATRVKLRTFWKNTVIYRVIMLSLRALKWTGRKIYTLAGYLPLTWKSFFALFTVSFVNFLFAVWIGWFNAPGLVLPLFIIDLFFAACVIYVTMDIKKLEEAAARLATGELDYKVDTSKMRWNIKTHGDNLNRIGEGMQKAVEERMKSERLKTELITNVSHDIKTPLTSIINYVDILKKEGGSGEKAGEYIGILERQSARLKKLTEDLIEASKASAGAVAINPENMDVSELLRQAVGEYDEKLSSAGIEAVVSAPAGAIIHADGRLLWRVFDNLLSNITRYSQQSTRAYFTVENDGKYVTIIFRNISRDVLNVSADELVERFVRGDSARTDGGSGLGLSIARSLTEIMKGEFSILLDGDLFKAVIRFRAEGQR